MRPLALALASVALLGHVGTEAAAPRPTATPTAAARPLGLGKGFGGAATASASPTPAQTTAAAGDTLAGVAGRVKLKKLTPEELKALQYGEAGTASPPLPDATLGPEAQRARQDALAEYKQTTGPLLQERSEVDRQCRACVASCEGITTGSAISTDINGNWVVFSTTIDNSTTPSCRGCSTLCLENLDSLARRFNAAREKAIGKGVYRHELDVGRLVFGTTKE